MAATTVRSARCARTIASAGASSGRAISTSTGTPCRPTITDLTWRRLLDPAHPFQGLAALDEQERIDGIVHFHVHASTWARVGYCYLEDLFVDPACRGQGIGRALIEAVYRAADDQGAERVYWHTQNTNDAGAGPVPPGRRADPVRPVPATPDRVKRRWFAEPTNRVSAYGYGRRGSQRTRTRTRFVSPSVRSRSVNRLASRLPAIVEQHQKEILAEWLEQPDDQRRLARRPHPGSAAARRVAALPGAVDPGNPARRRVRHAQQPVGGDPRVPRRAVAQPRDAGVHARRRWRRSSFP